MASKHAADLLFGYLKDLIYNPSKARLDVSELPEEFVNLGKGLMYYGECVMETTTLARDLSRGELNGPSPSRGNEISSPLKSLQASLKHLTWQTAQVAKGDYKQRVSFMGEFADSFNKMTDQLDKRRNALLSEIEASNKKSEALLRSNILLEAITENISQWIVVIDRASTEWLYVNRDVYAVLHSKKTVHDLKKWLRAQVRETVRGNETHVLDLDLPYDGLTQYFSVAVHPLQWYENDAVAFVLTDTTHEKRELRKLETVAYYDPLTNVFNRHYGMEILAKWLSDDMTFVISFIDIDNLKYINDKYGHAEGDCYILKVANLLRSFSIHAVISRLGGDEFMLLSKEYELEEAENRLEELRDLLISNPMGEEIAGNYSLSYGVVQATAGKTNTASELLELADVKMYKYKRARKKQRDQTPSPSPLENSPVLV